MCVPSTWFGDICGIRTDLKYLVAFISNYVRCGNAISRACDAAVTIKALTIGRRYPAIDTETQPVY